jgi:hypothetical protein
MARRAETPRTCTFCGSKAAEVESMVKGPGQLAICSTCVWEAVKGIDAERVRAVAPDRRVPVVTEATLLLEDGSTLLVEGTFEEVVRELGADAAGGEGRICTFSVVDGQRVALRRGAIKQVLADPEPPAPC